MKRKQIIELFIGLIICLGIASEAQSQTVYQIKDEVNETILYLKDLPVFIDSTNSLTFSSVTSDLFRSKFIVNPNYQNKDFDEHATYWVQIPIKHKTSKLVWVMEFFDQTIDDLIIFKPELMGSFIVHEQGDRHLFENRENLHKNFTITLNNSTDTVQIYYARIRSHEFADIRIAIRSYSRFIYYALNEYFLFGTFYGMVLIIVLYNFLVYLAIREGNLRDVVGSSTRPVRELKAFHKIKLEAGASQKVSFKLSATDLSFYNYDLKFVAEPGEFQVFVGTNSRDTKEVKFTLLE